MKSGTEEIGRHNNVIITATPPPASDQSGQSLARRAFAIDSLRRKQRADSFFHSLTSSQQDKLLQWFEEIDDCGTIFLKVIAPPPEGFGVSVHLTSVRRLRARWRAIHFTSRNEEILDIIHDFETDSDIAQSDRIQSAISYMLHQKAFELTRTSPASEHLKRVLTSIEKLAALDYKRQKLQLEREKLLYHSRPHSTQPLSSTAQFEPKICGTPPPPPNNQPADQLTA